MLLLAGILGLCLIALLTQALVSVPWLGLTLASGNGGDAPMVAEVAPGSPADGKVAPGALVEQVRLANGETLVLTPELVAPEGAYALADAASFRTFFRAEALIHDTLVAGPVALKLTGDQWVTLEPANRPLASIAFGYWVGMLSGLAALLVGTGVWTYRRESPACRHFALNGVGMFLAAVAATPINHRELTLQPLLLEALTHINLLGVTLTCFALVALIWNYPVRLGRLPLPRLLYAAALVIATVSVLELSPAPVLLFQLPLMISMLVLFPLFGFLQWRRTLEAPADRAALLWLITVVLLTMITAVMANLLQVALAREVYLSTSGVYALVLVMYVALAFGVVRYRLFNLGQWWLEAMIWALSGIVVLVLDAFLLAVTASAGLSLGVALLVAGWLYFPLRQYLWRQLNPAAGQPLERHLPELIDTLLSARSAEDLERRWQGLLARVFQPLASQLLAQSCRPGGLDREGLVMHCPTVAGTGCLELSHAGKGKRLFSTADLRLAEAMLALTRQALALRRAEDARVREAALREEEKASLLRDLHDGVGSLVTTMGLVADLTLSQSTEPATRERLETLAGLSRETLVEVRAIMQAFDDELDWVTLAAQLRVLGRTLADAGGLTFDMGFELVPEAPEPDSVLSLNLSRFYKECLTNVLKHAGASGLEVTLTVGICELALVISDDGVGLPAVNNPSCRADGTGRGSANLAARAQRLGGRLQIQSAPGRGTCVRLTLPLAAIGTEVAHLPAAAGAPQAGYSGDDGQGAAA
ncbi:MAG: ATP-binding protein [Marinobacter sp.]|uniref:sensor histidine kinase n=1 Tax=Marinobacter sp. TaxID=50741 RepID=UPI00299D1D16|nr:ATP-binding protein [Marinobacter sp.]MDX1635218.1 ATP-binding protein [Marinobacter sp.]